MRILIEIIPHAEQRYETVGDWTGSAARSLTIRVSDTGDWRFNALIALHELVEAVLCEDACITAEQLDDFDMSWKPADGLTEPGDDPEAPYHAQHIRASALELRMSQWLHVDWDEYEDVLDGLGGDADQSEDQDE